MFASKASSLNRRKHVPSSWQRFPSLTYKNKTPSKTIQNGQMHNITQQLPDPAADTNNTPFENNIS